MNEDYEIPEKWKLVDLESICFTTSGGTPSRNNKAYFQGNIPWVKSGELNFNTIQFTEEKISEDAINNSSAKLIPKGTLLIALYGATVGKLAFLGIDAATNQAIASVTCFADMPNKYLYYYLFYKKSELLDKRIGGAQPNISQTILNALIIPLPPLNEQNRIVAKIEELFSDLDNGIANLKQAQNQLKAYRQALLKHAFEGKLTEKWRAENNPEPAEKLLERIKAERQKRYEQELDDWKKAVKAWEKDGKKGAKPGTPRFNPELTKVENDNSINEIPSCWLIQNLNNLSTLITDGKHGDSKDEKESGYYFLSAKDVNDGLLNYNNARQINFLEFQEVHNRTDLKPGDICLVNTGATVGKIALAPLDSKTYKTTFQKSVAVIKVIESIVVNKFLYYLLIERKRKLINTSKGTAVNNLLLKDIKNLVVPYTSISEQKEIIDLLEDQISIIEQLEQTIESSLSKSEALRQSILKKAFEGKLVPQDPADEPASVLLKRIQAEKEKYLEEQKQVQKRIKKTVKM